MTTITFGAPVLFRTRFAELTYGRADKRLWSFFNDGARVGPLYASKAELLADLHRFAREFGCEEVYASGER